MTPLEKPFSTARQLFDYVSPLNPEWDIGRYIFRGQPNDRYKLTPSVCRRGAGSFAYGSPRRMFDASSSGQVSLELDILKRFLNGCDKSGLIVPGYTEQLKDRFHNNINSFMSAHTPWPPASLYEIMAVAQHYDVPTRLLDWTERSLVACYFAASSANLEIDSMNMPRIAVWALDTSQAKYWETVKVIRTPGGTSKNQAAQSGLFTTHNVKDYSFNDFYQVEALEEVEEIYLKTGAYNPLIKVTLPVSEAPDLLNLCSRFGVDGSTLFPGFHGVAKSVRDWANVEVGVRPSRSLQDECNAESYDDDPDFH
ncbi:FRG domain-containing protein [Pseudomonas shahriarae]|uniref:FRG domain-containing protein n=1 Tax=Pseudomonas shahriarae TaxID=2745512 RepID=A0A9X4BZ57_9PSED|nr:FRG domain-containing protein [Pseudomonas shahriarae]MDD1007288.1 FRG domain-containing protein [Pseudomonas shahriarae]